MAKSVVDKIAAFRQLVQKAGLCHLLVPTFVTQRLPKKRHWLYFSIILLNVLASSYYLKCLPLCMNCPRKEQGGILRFNTLVFLLVDYVKRIKYKYYFLIYLK